MSKFRKVISSVLAGGIITAGSLLAAPAVHAASAAVPGCQPGSAYDGTVIYADRNGATFTRNTRLIGYGPSTCYYNAELWFSGNGSGPYMTEPVYAFSRPRT